MHARSLAREPESAKSLVKARKTAAPTGEIKCPPCNVRRSVFCPRGAPKPQKAARKLIFLSSAGKKPREKCNFCVLVFARVASLTLHARSLARESETAKSFGKTRKTAEPTGEIKCPPCNVRGSVNTKTAGKMQKLRGGMRVHARRSGALRDAQGRSGTLRGASRLTLQGRSPA